MIHELIDPKKKTVKGTTARELKTLNESKTFPDNCNFEQSDYESKGPESSSATFIPLWLKNSLGLTQRNNQNHATSDLKSAGTISRYREQNQNELDPLKTNTEQDCGSSGPSNCQTQETIPRGPDSSVSNHAKPVSVLWQSRLKDCKTDSENIEKRTLRDEASKMTSSDVITVEVGKVKDEERRRLRLNRQKNKIRRRSSNDPKEPDLGKSEVDFLLELKAREVLENYVKKDVHSVSSDMKQLEAKLILLSAKCHDVETSKFTPQEVRLLQEIKIQTGSKEDFERLMEHIREVNLKEILKNSDHLDKANGEKTKKIGDRGEKSARESICNSRCHDVVGKDSLISTDDENDIKRFSEFLSKNKNQDEKRKCLEEVRNYFEKKRRTRLTKRSCLEDAKLQGQPSITFPDKKEELLKEKQKSKDLFSLPSGKEKRSKFGLCDEEIVEKAVNETLQKFVDLYHFRISPTVMGSMKKKLLQVVQSDSFQPKASVVLTASKERLEEKKAEKDIEKDKEKERTNEVEEVVGDVAKDPDCVSPCSPTRNFSGGEPVSEIWKEVKKRSFKTVVENPEMLIQNPEREINEVEKENMKRLQKEFENFLNSIQAHSDVSGLKLQSLILEKEGPGSSTKNLQFVYNLSKKVLDSNNVEYCTNLEAVRETQELRNWRESETQTQEKTDTKKNAKTQTNDLAFTCDQCLQTDEKTYVTSTVQTESDVNVTELRDLKELKGFNINPGLYRMVKSKEPGRFYLYPEKLEENEDQDNSTPNDSSVLKVCNTGKLERKKEYKKFPKDKPLRERRTFLRDKERGKHRKTKKEHILPSKPSEKLPSKKQEVAGEENTETSINCLYFRDLEEDASDSYSIKKDEDAYDKPGTSKVDKEAIKEIHQGCSWLWNGEKITPGCDLKTHVENLLKEKLREIANCETQSKSINNGSILSNSENGQVMLSKSSEKNLDMKSGNSMFSISRGGGTQEDTIPAVFAAENDADNKAKKDGAEKGENEEAMVSTEQIKPVKDVGTQNSRQTLLSQNEEELKSRSKTPSISMTKIRKKKLRKKNQITRPVHDTREKAASFKKAAEIIRAVREIKKIKYKESCGGMEENTPDSGTTEEGSSCSTASKNYTDDTLSLILELKNNDAEELRKLDVKNQIRKIIGLVDHEVQTADLLHYEDTTPMESQALPIEGHKHWGLIESVLNRVNHREREGLWNDVRNFIKTKIGRDINDDGAREVCIEIEQDLPKPGPGKAKQTVMAKGHYTRNEGDVEVEIDLTLDDLERILRHRQRKLRKRQLYRKKTRRLISSSSVQSELPKDDHRKYIQSFKALENLVKEKNLKMFKKNKEN